MNAGPTLPPQLAARLELVRSLTRAKKLAEARQELRGVKADLEPSPPAGADAGAIWDRLAECHAGLGEYPSAVEHLERVASISGRTAVLEARIIDMRSHFIHESKVDKEIVDLLSKTPLTQELLAVVVGTCRNLHNPRLRITVWSKRAWKLVGQWTRTYPDDYWAWHNGVTLALRMQDEPMARKYVRRARECLDPNSPDDLAKWREIRSLCETIGMPDETLEAAVVCFRLWPADVANAMRVARLAHTLREVLSAEEIDRLFDMLTKRPDRNPNYWASLAESLSALGRHEMAKAAIDRALTLDPDNQRATATLRGMELFRPR